MRYDEDRPADVQAFAAMVAELQQQGVKFSTSRSGNYLWINLEGGR